MAESKRRGEDAVDEDLDEVLDDDALADDEDTDVDDPESADALLERRNGKRRPAKLAKDSPDKPDDKAKVATDTERVGIFGRLGRFVREVVAELRKVIWPTRKELLTYTAVVIVFVTIMLTIVGLLDLGFAKGVLFVFGGKK
ncbi:MAG TPA: preprotein translocase subunit SecE [Rugosimonospora sp.]|nr:preprotein translocase subunit SecE [Rugosimonospora sp.]